METMSERVHALKAELQAACAGSDQVPAALLDRLLDTMSAMAERIDANEKKLEDLDAYVETLDDDLADLEDALFEDDGNDDGDDDADEDDGQPRMLSDLDEIHYACPHCGHPLTFRAADIDLDEDLPCPACGKPVFPELEDEE